MIGRRLVRCSKGAGDRCYGRWNHGDGMGCSCCGSCGPSSGKGGDNLNIYDKTWQFQLSAQRTSFEEVATIDLIGHRVGKNLRRHRINRIGISDR